MVVDVVVWKMFGERAGEDTGRSFEGGGMMTSGRIFQSLIDFIVPVDI